MHMRFYYLIIKGYFFKFILFNILLTLNKSIFMLITHCEFAEIFPIKKNIQEYLRNIKGEILMNKKILTLILLLSVFFAFSNEKEISIYEPAGKLTFKYLTTCIDEANKEINLYQNSWIGSFNPTFLYIFTRTKEDLTEFTEYHKNLIINNMMFNFGLDSAILLVSLSAAGGVYLAFAQFIGAGIFFGVGGVFLIASAIFFAFCGYYYVKTKKIFNSMIEKYNAKIGAASLKDAEISLDLFCINLN
jgi:hypothetical protein